MKTAILSFILFLSHFCGAQHTLQYVPADAPFVLSMNLGNLGNRVNLNTLKQYDFYKALMSQMEQSQLEPTEQAYLRKFFDSPADLGFDMLRPFYFFVKEKGDTTFFTMVMEMGNKAKYEAGLIELHPDTYEANLTEKNNYQIWQDATDTYVWNDKVILNIWSEYTPSYDDWEIEEPLTYDSLIYDINSTLYEELPPPPPPLDSMDVIFENDTLSNYNDEYEFDYGFWETDTKGATARWADELMSRQIGTPLSANTKYKNAKANSADLHFWMDYGYLIKEMKSNGGIGGGMSDEQLAPFVTMAEGFVEKIYSDAYLSWGLSFENGEMAVRSQQFFNNQFQDFYAGIRKVKFNKKFFRYMEGGDDMFGYAYFNFNIKNAIEKGRPLLHDMLSSSPTYGQAASDAVKIMGIFIDEDAIANLMKGDMMLSFSGMQDVTVTEKTYDFDEDFNYVEKDTVINKTIPKFTALATFGNKKNVMKFIDFGLHSEFMEQDGANYKMTEPTSGMEFYLGLHKNMLMLSNNRELLFEKLQKGLPKQKRLGKKHRKLLCENSAIAYWDVPNTMRQTNDPNSTDNFSPMYYLNVFGKQFESLSWKSTKKVEGALENEFYLNFKNKGTNSLEQFFIFINDIWLEFEGGAKI